MQKFKFIIIDYEISAREDSKILVNNYFGNEKVECVECAFVDYDMKKESSTRHVIKYAKLNNDYFDFAIFSRLYPGEYGHRNDETGPRNIIEYLKVFPFCVSIIYSYVAGYYPKKNEPIDNEYYWGINKEAQQEQITKLLELVTQEWMEGLLTRRIGPDDRLKIKTKLMQGEQPPTITTDNISYDPGIYLFPMYKKLVSEQEVIKILS